MWKSLFNLGVKDNKKSEKNHNKREGKKKIHPKAAKLQVSHSSLSDSQKECYHPKGGPISHKLFVQGGIV